MSSRFALLALVLMCSGCSDLLHRDTPAPQTYVLRAPESPLHAMNSAGTATPRGLDTDGRPSSDIAALPTLQLPRPSADPGLATELITLVRSDHRMDYYANSRWASDLPDVVETLAIDTLRTSGVWGAVQDAPSPFLADYLLQINIRRFEADYTGGGVAPKVYVTFDCTLARRVGRDPMTSFVAEGSAEAGENRLSAVVAAFEKAANTALATMAEHSAAAIQVVATAKP